MLDMSKGGDKFKVEEPTRGSPPVMPFFFQQLVAAKAGDHLNGDTPRDAEEFLEVLLDKIHEEDSALFNTRPKMINEFEHQTGWKYSCMRGHVDHVKDTDRKSKRVFTVVSDITHATNLQACIGATCEKMRVASRKCSKCGGRLKMSKAIVDNPPDHLIVKVDRHGKNGEKLNNDITFPTSELELSDVCLENVKYKVYAVCEHHGESENSGRYTVVIKNGEEWFNVENAKVSKAFGNAGKNYTAGSLFFLEKSTP
jgi:uncharacterized UBP type Zn finger protein